MRTSLPISFILIPTIFALALFLYSLFSDRWVGSNFDEVEHMSVDKSLFGIPDGLTVLRERMAFIKRLGMFRKCIEYRWLNVIDLNSTNVERKEQNTRRSCMRACVSGEIRCGRCCISGALRCDHVPDCDSHDDELQCPRLFEDPVWLDEVQRCFKHRIDIFHIRRGVTHREATNALSSYYPSIIPRGPFRPSEHFLHNVQAWMLIATTLLQVIVIISLTILKPCQKHPSIPFTFITIMCVLGFLSGATVLFIFLWNWVHRKINMGNFYYLSAGGDPPSRVINDAVIYRLNPWLCSIEHLDVAFYIACGAVGLCLLQSAIAFMFFCGATTPRMSFQKGGGKRSYEIVKVLPPYEDHYLKT